MDNPVPRDWKGPDDEDFTVIRLLDGPIIDADPKVRRNPYHPSTDSMGGLDEPIEPEDTDW